MVSKKNNHHLNAFFKEEYNSLKNYVRSQINSTVDRDAEDIIQDVALKIFSRPEDSLPIHNVGGFVYNAIKNRIIDIMRAKPRRVPQNDGMDDLWQAYTELFYASQPTTYSEELKDTLKRRLRN